MVDPLESKLRILPEEAGENNGNIHSLEKHIPSKILHDSFSLVGKQAVTYGRPYL
jgi:hypothetical protein